MLQPFDRLRPEAEVTSQIEGSLAAEVSSIVLDSLEHLVQVGTIFLSSCSLFRQKRRNTTNKLLNNQRKENKVLKSKLSDASNYNQISENPSVLLNILNKQFANVGNILASTLS